MFNFLKKKQPKLVGKKSMSFQQAFSQSLNGGGLEDAKLLTAKKALFYYDLVAPVATAVDIVNDAFKTLTLAVEHKDGKKTLDDDVLKFLRQPNDDMVRIDFLENMGNYYLTTNEVYFVATGRPNRAPAELTIESPEHVDVKTDENGYINKFIVRKNGRITETFFRADKDYRFFNKTNTAEIWQVKGFNTRQTARGRSKLSSAVYEIEQYLQAAIHNLSLLENGVRTTGAFTADEPLTDEQFQRLRDQIIQNQAGAQNAGQSIILEGGMDYKEMSLSPKDMDFEKLKQSTTEAIFKRYKIPLALVSTDHMAEATMDASMLMLYDIVVIPLAERIFAELTRFLAPRFNLSDDEKIVPYKEDIQALQIRTIKEVKNKKETGVHTIDEIRKTMGDDPLPDGKGEDLYIPRNLVKIGEENLGATGTGVQGADNRQKPGDADMNSDTPTDDERVKMTRESFISILKSQVDVKGVLRYTDEEIEGFANEEEF